LAGTIAERGAQRHRLAVVKFSNYIAKSAKFRDGLFAMVQATSTERVRKHQRGIKTDLRQILETLPEIQEELREQRHLLEILTAAQAAEGAQQSEQGQH
jgi:hypothetical protein